MSILRGIKFSLKVNVRVVPQPSRWLSDRTWTPPQLKWLAEDVDRFKIDIPVERASTPPATWYTDQAYHDLELKTLFRANWLPIGRTDQVANSGSFFTGSVGRSRYVVLRDNDKRLRAFHNICRHRGMLLCTEEAGQLSKFSCPYHGWTYDLSGRLTKATQLRGIKDFSARNFGLKPMSVTEWGPLVFIADDDEEAGDAETFRGELSSLLERLRQHKFTDDWKFVRRTRYILNCNWKVVCDNILDNGYHVTATHPKYSKLLDLSSLRTEILGRSSLCSVSSASVDDRVSGDVILAHIFPNLIINRYGDWLDTNIVLPLSHDKCEIIYDYYLPREFPDDVQGASYDEYVNKCINESNLLQEEDNAVCEGVQQGLQSSAYEVGRYAPGEERPDYNFHVNIAREFRAYLEKVKH